ncbi:hypothetical protein TSUD_154790 [Trifolium subterraneum]|uniref:Uncharacterized protein n=1 Tax=Trifolium subterraneum TaxID=3900 RepID=A0A2Z6M068_TRISU|nr:hypothetical protein TSUD_154790 [Trifolium subterraneum]
MIEDRKGKRSTCGEEPLQEPSQMGKAVAVMRHPPLYACRYGRKGRCHLSTYRSRRDDEYLGGGLLLPSGTAIGQRQQFGVVMVKRAFAFMNIKDNFYVRKGEY